MANTKLRNIQFYRNGDPQTITNETSGSIIGDQTYLVNDLKSAYVYAEASFKHTEKYKDMLDGEILLYRFSYDSKVHTLVGVVHVSGDVHSLEVLANYDMLGAEISNEIDAAIAELDGSATIATVNDNVVTLKAGIVQTDGKVSQGEGTDIVLAKVAKTGTAKDVLVVDTEGVITATTVEDALAEIAKEINAMDLTATDVVALNAGKTALQAGKISETDGKVAVAAAETFVEFNQALSDTNKVATMADVTAAQNNATVVGEKAIEVKAATGEGATGKVVSLKINSNDKVLTQDANGLLANISLTYDSDAKEIKLLGKNGENGENATPVVISTIDADDFVKDGMLQSAELVETQEPDVTTEVPYLKFTWNVDSDIQITRISVKKFIDTYTSGDLNTLTVSGYTITPVTATVAANATGLAVAGDVHAKIAATKGQDIQTITGETATTQGNYIDVKVTATKDADNNYTLSTTSNVTTQAVSTATSTENGLATASDVKTYVDDKVGLPYTATGELTMSDGRVITHNTKTGLPTDAKGSVSTNTINVPVITVNEYGHVTALDQQSYTVKYPTVSGTTGQILVDTTAATDTDGVQYTVKLATVSRTDTNTATDNFSDESNTFTFISGVTTDNYGRVTGVSTITMTENWDCGSW